MEYGSKVDSWYFTVVARVALFFIIFVKVIVKEFSLRLIMEGGFRIYVNLYLVEFFLFNYFWDIFIRL